MILINSENSEYNNKCKMKDLRYGDYFILFLTNKVYLLSDLVLYKNKNNYFMKCFSVIDNAIYEINYNSEIVKCYRSTEIVYSINKIKGNLSLVF